MTITLTQEQIEQIETLRNTSMANETKLNAKTFEEMAWSVIERGIASHLQTRKQYARTRAAVKAYAGK